MTRNYPSLRVLSFYCNHGQSAAFDAGIQCSSGKVIVTLDADLQNDPQDIPKLLGRLERDQLDVVAGWRKNRKDGFLLRTFPSKIANRLIRRVTGTQVHDLGCSLRVYRGDLVRRLRLYGEMHRYFCPLLETLGARVGEEVVEHRPRSLGQSKYGMSRVFKVLLDLVYVWFAKSYLSKPMYVLGGAGAVFVALALGLGVGGLVAGLGWLGVAALVALACGVLLFAAGILAELLVRTYFESRGAAPYLIREATGFDGEAKRQRSCLHASPV